MEPWEPLLKVLPTIPPHFQLPLLVQSSPTNHLCMLGNLSLGLRYTSRLPYTAFKVSLIYSHAAAAAAAKSLQSCLTLCDPIDGSPPGSPVPGILQARTLGWVAISFSSAWKCMKVKSESEVAQLCPTPSDPMDCSPPGSSIHGIFQARVLEWGAIAFSDFKPRRQYLKWPCGNYLKMLSSTHAWSCFFQF